VPVRTKLTPDPSLGIFWRTGGHFLRSYFAVVVNGAVLRKGGTLQSLFPGGLEKDHMLSMRHTRRALQFRVGKGEWTGKSRSVQ